jgi:protein-tyrosine phosphatase
MLMKGKSRVLFVCIGNICRSPIVETVARVEFARAGIDAEFASAGTEAYHVGQPADHRAISVAEANGYPLAAHRARQVRASDFESFDHVLAMDHVNLRALESHRLDQAGAVPALFFSAAGLGDAEVPDPYYGTQEDFERVVMLARAGVAALIERWRAQQESDGDGHARAGT